MLIEKLFSVADKKINEQSDEQHEQWRSLQFCHKSCSSVVYIVREHFAYETVRGMYKVNHSYFK